MTISIFSFLLEQACAGKTKCGHLGFETPKYRYKFIGSSKAVSDSKSTKAIVGIDVPIYSKN